MVEPDTAPARPRPRADCRPHPDGRPRARVAAEGRRAVPALLAGLVVLLGGLATCIVTARPVWDGPGAASRSAARADGWTPTGSVRHPSGPLRRAAGVPSAPNCPTVRPVRAPGAASGSGAAGSVPVLAVPARPVAGGCPSRAAAPVAVPALIRPAVFAGSHQGRAPPARTGN